MAFGFPASFFQYIPFNNLSKLQFLYISINSCEKLNWTILEINDSELIAETNPTISSWNEKITINYEREDPLIESTSNGNQLYDRGKNKHNTEVFFDLFNSLRKEITTTNLDLETIVVFISNSKEAVKKNKEKERAISSFYSVFSFLIPTKDYLITPLLLYLNILIFLVMFFSGVSFFSPTTREIIDWGGNYGSLTTENGWWRLVSCFFIHIGFFHLLLNCFALSYVGLFLESHLTRIGFFLLYLFCGILASLSSLYWNDEIVSAGASGAIFGMYGILLVALFTKTISKKLNGHTLFYIISFILINILDSFKEGVDAAAHFGGLVTGIAFGSIISLLKDNKKTSLIVVSAFAILLIPVVSIYCKNKKIYIYQIIEYEMRMQEFVDMEKMALEAYSISYDDSKEDLLYMIQERGIYYWEENINLIEELDHLSLPQQIHKQNKKLTRYCELRIQVYELAYKKIRDNTTVYDEQILALNYKITAMVEEIKKETKQ
jgi:rhomboid protease GluP